MDAFLAIVLGLVSLLGAYVYVRKGCGMEVTN